MTPYLSLTEAEAETVRAALTMPTCWSPQRREAALRVLAAALERQLSLLAGDAA